MSLFSNKDLDPKCFLSDWQNCWHMLNPNTTVFHKTIKHDQISQNQGNWVTRHHDNPFLGLLRSCKIFPNQKLPMILVAPLKGAPRFFQDPPGRII